MYRLLLSLFILILSCKEELPKTIDLRPPEDSFDGEYVELGGLDTIDNWLELNSSYCNSNSDNKRVFFRLPMNKNELVDSNYSGGQILVAPVMDCYEGCRIRRSNLIQLNFSVVNGSLQYLGVHIPGWSLSALLTSYYLFSDFYNIWGRREPYSDYRIFVESNENFQEPITETIKTLRTVSLAYLEVKEKEPQIPPLNIHMIYTPPAPPPPPVPDSSNIHIES